MLGLSVLDWALFVPTVPLSILRFQSGIGTWVVTIVSSYLLGHAVQGIANLCMPSQESAILATEKGSAPQWMKERARQTALKILDINSDQLEPEWVFRTLDQYAAQAGKQGDRDIFIYREGFYRGTAIALCLLAVTLLIRMCFSGCSIEFTKNIFHISRCELFLNAFITGGIAYLFLRRYRRFVRYRITHAVLTALVVYERSIVEDSKASTPNISGGSD